MPLLGGGAQLLTPQVLDKLLPLACDGRLGPAPSPADRLEPNAATPATPATPPAAAAAAAAARLLLAGPRGAGRPAARGPE